MTTDELADDVCTRLDAATTASAGFRPPPAVVKMLEGRPIDPNMPASRQRLWKAAVACWVRGGALPDSDAPSFCQVAGIMLLPGLTPLQTLEHQFTEMEKMMRPPGGLQN